MREALAAALLGLALAACGVPSDEAPRRLPSADVPFDLLGQRTSSPRPETGTRASRIYLVRGDHLAATVRRGPRVLAPVEVVRALVEGPVGDEPSRGLRTAVPRATDVLRAEVTGSVVTVDLSTDFTSVGSEQQILALAQVVYSLTELPGIAAVRFLIDGVPVQVPREDGSLTAAPLVRADYDAVTGR